MTTDEKGVFIQIQNTIVSLKALALVKLIVSTLLSMIVAWESRCFFQLSFHGFKVRKKSVCEGTMFYLQVCF